MKRARAFAPAPTPAPAPGRPHVIVVGNHKGGAGKSTVAMHLAYDLPAEGEDVLALSTTAWQSATLVANGVQLTGCASGRPVAVGSVTYRIVRPRD